MKKYSIPAILFLCLAIALGCVLYASADKKEALQPTPAISAAPTAPATPPAGAVTIPAEEQKKLRDAFAAQAQASQAAQVAQEKFKATLFMAYGKVGVDPDKFQVQEVGAELYFVPIAAQPTQ